MIQRNRGRKSAQPRKRVRSPQPRPSILATEFTDGPWKGWNRGDIGA